jgi:hypothetical protein
MLASDGSWYQGLQGCDVHPQVGYELTGQLVFVTLSIRQRSESSWRKGAVYGATEDNQAEQPAEGAHDARKPAARAVEETTTRPAWPG